MKLTTVFLVIFGLHLSASTRSQEVTLSVRNASLETVLQSIKTQTHYSFFSDGQMMKYAKPVTLNLKNAPLKQALDACFKDQPFTYSIDGTVITISERTVAQPEVKTDLLLPPPPVIIKGRVVDDKSGEPVADVTVTIKGTTIATNTNKDGEFQLTLSGAGNTDLVITHIGYAPKSVIIKNNDYITIKLAVVEQSLADVEISTGMFKRKKESFTGATATFTGDQLRTIGNRNIITSLKTLDPSFVVLENNRLGSNPNALPSIELRGKTSINTSTTTTTDLNNQYASDPNLPLFVLNGFPASLQIINNLDMNRVASVTILKDAASTAIWGSKAANGVVVIETKRPIPGELRVNYTGDFIVDAPDLSSYNMMNAAEKLEFERLAGLYSTFSPYSYESEVKYNERLADVNRGVNTDWLSEPVNTAFTNKHSLQVSGGSNDFIFGAGLSYGNQNGVMKGSGRKTWGGNIDLTYRRGKLNITNQLYMTGYKANESPYGSFGDFVRTNPFLIKRNADGTIPKFADASSGEFYEYNDPSNGSVGGYTVPVVNPLYNASLFGINQTENFDVLNNLQAMYSLSPDLRLQGGLQVSNGNTSTTVFVSPENSAFDATVPTEKGSYTRIEQKQKGYSGNVSATYAKLIRDNHSLTFTLRADVAESTIRNTGFKAIGFPEGTNGNPAFSNQFDPYSKPASLTSVVRSYSGTGILNYAYKMRYLLDMVYTLNGSNAFGSNKKTQPSWSVGLGWNLHKEAIFQQYSWLNLLKLRANVGVSGNEQLGTFSSNAVYTALPGNTFFGQSLALTSLGNPELDWQSTRSTSTGVEITVLNNRLSAVVNYFEKKTDPLIVGASGILPSSTGLDFSHPFNVGELTYKGWEANVRVSPVYRIKERTVWTISATASKIAGKYNGFGNTLASVNKGQIENKGLLQFRDGYSPDDIWAVVSRGIDPATGRELFEKQDGSETFQYSSDYAVKVGNSRPKVEGVISSNFTYKGLYVNLAIRYRVAGYMMNTSLYDKVENISYQQLRYNQDKRALYDRWQNPGDVTEFKGISLSDYTPISSRFVQKDSHVIGESISIGWDFMADSWIRKLNMQGLRIYAYTSDIFRLTSIKTERGIEYPFARSVSLGISASF